MAERDRSARPEHAPAAAARPPGRVLVLGATGFLGRHVCAAFAAAGGEVVGAARHRGTSPSVRRWAELDLASGVAHLAGLLVQARPEVVVNAAGCVHGSDDELARANVALVRDLLEAVAAAASPPRLVHLGSSAEYGLTGHGTRLGEDAPLRPVGPYGRTKAEASQALLEAFAAGRADGAVLRVFNPVGPGAPPAGVLGRVAVELARQEGSAEARVVVGPLGSYRDFVDARDVAEAALLAATAVPAPARALNVARGEAVLVRHAVELLVKVARPDALVVEEGAGSSRSSAVDWQEADVTAARAVLGWAPRRALETSLADLWQELAAPGGATAP